MVQNYSELGRGLVLFAMKSDCSWCEPILRYLRIAGIFQIKIIFLNRVVMNIEFIVAQFSDTL